MSGYSGGRGLDRQEVGGRGRPDQTALTGLKAATLLRLAWSWLRQVSGDAAYENYLRCTRHHVPAGSLTRSSGSRRPPSRAEFYLDSLHRRYSSVSRCC